MEGEKKTRAEGEVRRRQDQEFSFRNINFEMTIRLSSLGAMETFGYKFRVPGRDLS